VGDQEGGIHSEGVGKLLQDVQVDRLRPTILEPVHRRARDPGEVGEGSLRKASGFTKLADPDRDGCHTSECMRPVTAVNPTTGRVLAVL